MKTPQTICCAPGCNELTESRYCSAHQHNYDMRRGTVKQRGYSGRAWQAARRQVLRRDPWCRACKVSPSVHVDHVIPKPMGSDDLTNLQGLCAPCHSRKTRHEQLRPGEMLLRRDVSDKILRVLDGYRA